MDVAQRCIGVPLVEYIDISQVIQVTHARYGARDGACEGVRGQRPERAYIVSHYRRAQFATEEEI